MKMFAAADAGRLEQKTKPVVKITVQRESRNNRYVPQSLLNKFLTRNQFILLPASPFFLSTKCSPGFLHCKYQDKEIPRL